ncbi:uncharacterized protein L969DRAFT_93548 [Mixia osmundae IAM 14324]|uniref:Uncharacterized protein n=1 Tax=Mixia osmundae (strain CBS 9802 / IAM 14324 / JCM 22182 / KY 12970) TaxID=764103 RepID=G7DUA7_MIXOS|nr:uncharacterized protein L969DRAFT_93548 [Mixia osmundae IAM 14324]KEI41039.1 hypothetical protein L969DRAFT_93548 [Mixia osmundae IAM 14324]GAA94167.1 hypothetical protein E5Q_00815 [Mixia osmundae IAM 14324]
MPKQIWRRISQYFGRLSQAYCNTASALPGTGALKDCVEMIDLYARIRRRRNCKSRALQTLSGARAE